MGPAGLARCGAISALHSIPVEQAGWGPLSVGMWVVDRSEGESARSRSGGDCARSPAFDSREQGESAAIAASSKIERENAR